MISLETLIELVKTYNPEEIEKVKKAYQFADYYHEGQMRESGEPYISHPLNVAYILAEMHADGDTICAGLLHDVLEDTAATKKDLINNFNEDVATLVEGVTNISKINFTSSTERKLSNTRKIIMGIAKDVRIIIIKLADRLHNMRTLKYKRELKQKENALETMEIFVPLANYLGTYRIKCELEDFSFFYLKPTEYEKISSDIEELKLAKSAILHDVLKEICDLLNQEGIPNQIKIRIKNIYGVYKQAIQAKQLSDIHDLLGLRVVVEDVKQCYLTLMLIHSKYKPLDSNFKDYICNPKTNLYQSLHTTVFGPEEQLIQTRIRTHEMDKIASYGLPAYWDLYKAKARHIMQDELKNKFQFFRTLNENDHMFSDNAEFVEKVKQEIFTSNIYVYSSKGEIIELPCGSTVIDFAYRIHTDIGNMMVGAIVNDRVVDLNYQLQSNDRVKIITSNFTEGPTERWLESARTSHAKRKIKEFTSKN